MGAELKHIKLKMYGQSNYKLVFILVREAVVNRLFQT